MMQLSQQRHICPPDVQLQDPELLKQEVEELSKKHKFDLEKHTRQLTQLMTDEAMLKSKLAKKEEETSSRIEVLQTELESICRDRHELLLLNCFETVVVIQQAMKRKKVVEDMCDKADALLQNRHQQDVPPAPVSPHSQVTPQGMQVDDSVHVQSLLPEAHVEEPSNLPLAKSVLISMTQGVRHDQLQASFVSVNKSPGQAGRELDFAADSDSTTQMLIPARAASDSNESHDLLRDPHHVHADDAGAVEKVVATLTPILSLAAQPAQSLSPLASL